MFASALDFSYLCILFQEQSNEIRYESLLYHHGGRRGNPLLAAEPAEQAQAVPRHHGDGQIIPAPYVRTLRAAGARRKFHRGDQPTLQGTDPQYPSRDPRRTDSLRADRPQYRAGHRLRRLLVAETRSRSADDRHAGRSLGGRRGGVPLDHRRVPRFRDGPRCVDDPHAPKRVTVIYRPRPTRPFVR